MVSGDDAYPQKSTYFYRIQHSYDLCGPDKKELLTYNCVDCCKHEEGLEDVSHEDSLHAAQS